MAIKTRCEVPNFPHMSAMQEADLINIKAIVERMGMDQSSPYYMEYQRHLLDIAKETLQEMTSLQMKIIRNRVKNRIRVEKLMSDVDKLRIILQKKKLRLEFIRAVP
jgi:hypothetical protein